MSPGVKHANYFDQAAGNVACVAEVLSRTKRFPSELASIGFYVLAPKSQIDLRIFEKDLNRGLIREKVERRVKEYGGEKDNWLLENFIPAWRCMKIAALSWEGLIGTIIMRSSPTQKDLKGKGA